MDTLLQIFRQENIEKRYNRKLIDIQIREELMASHLMRRKIAEGVQYVKDYCGRSYYDSKNERVKQVAQLNLEQLVVDMFVGISYFQEPTIFRSAAAQLAGRLGFDDKRAAITTVSELLAVLCQTDLFDIEKPHKMASLMVISRMVLSEELIGFINQSMYLPPMVCTPLHLDHNYSSGYLSHKDSLILGRGNHHQGDICLDVLNIVNQVPLQLDMDFLCAAPEDPKEEFTVERVMESYAKNGIVLNEAQAKEILYEQRENWEAFRKRSQQVYLLIHGNGNRFYLTHKVDKRGRIYSQGYHINTQGASFKKAAVELADEELIEGVPV